MRFIHSMYLQVCSERYHRIWVKDVTLTWRIWRNDQFWHHFKVITVFVRVWTCQDVIHWFVVNSSDASSLAGRPSPSWLAGARSDHVCMSEWSNRHESTQCTFLQTKDYVRTFLYVAISHFCRFNFQLYLVTTLCLCTALVRKVRKRSCFRLEYMFYCHYLVWKLSRGLFINIQGCDTHMQKCWLRFLNCGHSLGSLLACNSTTNPSTCQVHSLPLKYVYRVEMAIIL